MSIEYRYDGCLYKRVGCGLFGVSASETTLNAAAEAPPLELHARFWGRTTWIQCGAIFAVRAAVVERGGLLVLAAAVGTSDCCVYAALAVDGFGAWLARTPLLWLPSSTTHLHPVWAMALNFGHVIASSMLLLHSTPNCVFLLLCSL